jgi:hypothetical protein
MSWKRWRVAIRVIRPTPPIKICKKIVIFVEILELTSDFSDRYVIRAVIYEIGILSNSPANETEEEMQADAEGKDEIT